jgi:hypothetical protein
MKSKIIVFSTFLALALCSGFIAKYEIASCYISFAKSGTLEAAPAERLPGGSEKFRKLNTDSGEVQITRIDGYRVLYSSASREPFVNMKVELSDSASYVADQEKIIANLKYLSAKTKGMETKDLVQLKFNGYKVSGLSRGDINSGTTLGIFVLFPGNGVTVYFYFNNIKSDIKYFENLSEYKKMRDKFIEDYTKHLTGCKGK